VPHAATPEQIIVNEEGSMEMVPEKEASKAHEVILADAKPELLQPCLFNMIIGDYEESPSRMIVTPSSKAKLSAHSMCAQESSLHTYRTENGYRITNVTIELFIIE
jgi:hypothetical protein